MPADVRRVGPGGLLPEAESDDAGRRSGSERGAGPPRGGLGGAGGAGSGAGAGAGTGTGGGGAPPAGVVPPGSDSNSLVSFSCRPQSSSATVALAASEPRRIRGVIVIIRFWRIFCLVVPRNSTPSSGISDRIGRPSWPSTSRSSRRPPITAVSWFRSSMCVTSVLDATRGRSIVWPDTVKRSKPGIGLVVPLSERCCGITVIMILSWPGITCGITRSWKPTLTGLFSSSSTEKVSPPFWFDAAVLRA